MGTYVRKVFLDNLNFYTPSKFIMKINLSRLAYIFNVENIGKISPSFENKAFFWFSYLIQFAIREAG